jgi:branched-chain amino acid transport system permease protein
MSNTTESIRDGRSAEERRAALLERLNPMKMDLRYQLGLLGLLGFVLLPQLFYPGQMETHSIIGFLYLIMFAMSWDVVSGYTGQLSFGHAFFFVVGGYTSAILNIQHGLTPLLSIPIAVVAAAAAGVVVGVPALRLRGPYLSLVTLIVPIIMLKLFRLYNDSFTPFGLPIAPDGLGGTSGVGIPDNLIGTAETAAVQASWIANFFPQYGTDQVRLLSEYYVSLGLMVLILVVLLAVTRSTAGDIFTAIREDEDAVSAAGLNPAKFKLFAFVLSGVVGGLAGAAFVHTSGAVAAPGPLLGGAGQASSPISMSINVIIISILGGTGTIVGPIVGAVFFAVSNTVIGGVETTIPLVGKSLGALKPLPLLFAAMLVLFYLPGGLLRGGIRAGRFALAVARGEKRLRDAQVRERLESTALGQIVRNYRRDLREELREITDPNRGENR